MVGGLTAIAKAFPDNVKKALHQEVQIEVTEMKKRCPVDTTDNAPHPGNLRASIHAEEPQGSGRTLTQMVATGIQAPYAIYVHEDLDAFHPVGQAKFMESVIQESAPYMAERIAKRINFSKSKSVADYLSASTSMSTGEE